MCPSSVLELQTQEGAAYLHCLYPTILNSVTRGGKFSPFWLLFQGFGKLFVKGPRKNVNFWLLFKKAQHLNF